MIDSIKKTLLAGVGAALATSDKVQASLEEFVRQGKVSAEDARAMADKIAHQGRKEFDDASAKLHEAFSSVIAKLDVKSQERIKELEARIAALEAKTGKHTTHTTRSGK
jgi:polyhydroxyalkanoate synthesis regulator phasin